MKFSAAAAFTLLATAQAASLIHLRRDDALDTRVTRDLTGRAVDPAASLAKASESLKLATDDVNAAITALGATAAPASANAALGVSAALNSSTPANGTAGAVTKGDGGALKAVTATGLLLPDGRIPADFKPENFNVLASPFKSAVVKGEGLVFSDIISFPDVPASMFDAAGKTKAFEISINDSSIFVPGGAGGTPQKDFRRADVLPSIVSTAQNSSVTGVRTVHWSVQQDAAKPLALATNEYQLAFLETADFESRTFDCRVGTGTTSASLTGGNIVVYGRSGAAIKELFVAPFTPDLQNFAVTLDFDKNTIAVFHSTAQTPLVEVAKTQANDNSGGGEYHWSLLKLADKDKAQAAGINEGIIFSGIFFEDSSDGTVVLK